MAAADLGHSAMQHRADGDDHAAVLLHGSNDLGGEEGSRRGAGGRDGLANAGAEQGAGGSLIGTRGDGGHDAGVEVLR